MIGNIIGIGLLLLWTVLFIYGFIVIMRIDKNGFSRYDFEDQRMKNDVARIMAKGRRDLGMED